MICRFQRLFQVPQSVTLNDMQGREIISQQIFVNEGQNSAAFNVKSPVKGIYVLRISDGISLVTKKGYHQLD